ncbi:YmfQ family protein [Pseudomonas mosselii]|uniref:YmfQ family protein n=1 Tax=Pseudomonas mosselii TaxID=78327 RepID=A0ABX9AXH3_9PSED|nr:putative phage tail protein [Pseudomonas mosselii]MBH3308554.1 DUF2313 domain-containing protein [Pseudomonas mosselii]MBH3322951.1 DUF2313 domain-containing protein [Pseudomonas mosselii]MCH7418541.1 YmfQ family protein [Pseudomonas mosselii]MCU9527638.1 YmfQ family protein [Pseudomonas mosselii]MCU9536246.1 YmfQ family protein [Pseudomonas mosselii]
MAGLRNAADYHQQLRALLPDGPAWDPERVPELDQVLAGTAEELAGLDRRIRDLQFEMDPATFSELVSDWERVMQLPDACLGSSAAFEDRRLAVRQRLLAVGGQHIAYYLELAQGQGYPSPTVTEHRAPRFGRVRFGRDYFGTWQAQFMWTLNTGGRQRLGRRFGASYFGERFGLNPGNALECLIRRSAPAHTQVRINYD